MALRKKIPRLSHALKALKNIVRKKKPSASDTPGTEPNNDVDEFTRKPLTLKLKELSSGLGQRLRGISLTSISNALTGRGDSNKNHLRWVMSHLRTWRNALILLTAALSAHSINAIIGAILVNPKASSSPGRSAYNPPEGVRKNLAAYNSIYQKTFFDRDGFIPSVGGGGDPSKIDLSSAVPTTLSLELIGTIVVARDEISIASIRDLGSNTIEAYQKGNPIGNTGATLFKVTYQKVYLLRQNGTLEYLATKEEPGALNLKLSQSSSAPNDGIQAESDTNYTINRKYLEQKLDNISEIVTQARAIPHFENGQIVGFRIINIEKDSVFEKLGICEGGVISELNGTPLNNQGQALAAYTALKENPEGNIEIVQNCNGVKKVMSYNVKN